MKPCICPEDLARFEAGFDADRANRVAMNAAVKNGLDAAAVNFEAPRTNLHAFSIEVEAGDVTNQKSSGRCWMFASLNLMRLEVMKKLNLKNMELSQSYPLFYDKLERANFFLENILATLDEPKEGRLLAYLLSDLMGDGGQWDMFRSLVAKYGVVPQDVMPESFSSSNTGKMNKLLRTKLRGYACELRAKAAAGASPEELRAAKDEMMATVYRMLCIALGKPPVRFTWETQDKDGQFVRVANVTPQEFFAEYVGWNLDDYVTVINAPTADKPYGRTYTVKYLGNIVDPAYPVKYLNLPIEDLKALTIAQLKDGRIVWFGSDVGQFSDRELGFLTTDAYDYAGLFATDFPMTKAERLDFGESQMTHAMAITGVDLDEAGQPIRWKVENSWGKDTGKDGYYVMSDAWFNEFTYQILLDRKYFSAEQAAQFDTDPIALEPWDPMGSLAK
ncbi:MAG: C1 family peptidase [Firmicutes bacterium]|nr:C1 family peptidase [Bacillota bacterium]